MLLVISPNLAIDRVLEVRGLQMGAVHRTSSVLAQAGGKGSNVARVFRQLGGEVAVTGFVGGQSGSWIVEQLQSLGIAVDVVEGFKQESRTCTIIRDPDLPGRPTVINEESPEVESEAVDMLVQRVEAWLPRVRAVVITGSLSRGLSATFYQDLVRRAGRQRKLVALDAAGQALREGLKAHPAFVKPNAEEFAELTGLREKENAFDRIAQRIRSQLNSSAEQFAVTLGERGAVLVAERKGWYARPPKIFEVNPIGAGDAFLAGYIKGVLDGFDPRSSFRLAIAAATCDAGTLPPGFIDRQEVEKLADQVEVIPV